MLQAMQEDGKTVGLFNRETNEFSKKVKASKHLFQKTDSWSIGVQTLTMLNEETKIFIIDEENAKTYMTTARIFADESDYFQFGEYGRQAFLPREHFTVS